jgi:hypothetical protein
VDYPVATLGVTAASTAAATVRALGATPLAYFADDLSPWQFDGAELDLRSIESTHAAVAGRSSVTANVAFWPRVFVIVGNEKALAKLASEQRRMLRDAGRRAVGPAVARLRAEDSLEANALCRRDHVSLVAAADPEIAALQKAVRPVYAQLEENSVARSLIAKIEAMKRESPSDQPPSCTAAAPARQTTKATPLDGTWEMRATVAQVAAETHTTRQDAAVDAGLYRMILKRGHVVMYHLSTPQWGGPPGGVLTVHHGGTVEFRFPDGDEGVYRFNLYRDTLILRYPPGKRQGAPNPTFAPWHRVRR